LYEKFANAWRVTNTTSLFDYAPGTSTKDFTIASWPLEAPQSCVVPPQAGAPPAKPPVKALTLEAARQQCRDIAADDRRANCEQDVMVTGEIGFAKTYLLTQQIERNTIPTTPALTFPADNTASLATPISFSWNKANDVNGDRVTYRHCIWVPGERLTL